jgi:pyruvate-ferredoxin/flavodoxin oxidoreductase
VVQEAMDRLGRRTGRHYHLVVYHGQPAAERVLVVMGSGGETARETIDLLA